MPGTPVAVFAEYTPICRAVVVALPFRDAAKTSRVSEYVPGPQTAGAESRNWNARA